MRNVKQSRRGRISMATCLVLLAVCCGCPQKNPPVADFTAAPLTGTAPLSVTFTDKSDPETSPITNWMWEFGDGSVSTLKSPLHTYIKAGTYNVSLKVVSAHGSNTKLRSQYVKVNAAGEGEGEGEKAALSLGAVTAAAGAVAQVPLTYTAGDKQGAAAVVEVSYDPAKMQYTSVAPGAAATGAAKSVTAREAVPGLIRIVIFGDTAAMGDGPVALVNFTLTGAASGETVPVTAVQASLSSANAVAQGVDVESGEVTVN